MHNHYTRNRLLPALPRLLPVLLLAVAVVVKGQEPPREIHVTMGDYQYAPAVIEMQSGEILILHLTNTDRITPHNFTLVDPAAGLDVDTDIRAGGTASIRLSPPRPGSYTWYCNKKLPFMKSHRDRGMQGTLVVH